MGILGEFGNFMVDAAKDEYNRRSNYLEKARELDDETLIKRIKSSVSSSGQRSAYIYEAKKRGLRP